MRNPSQKPLNKTRKTTQNVDIILKAALLAATVDLYNKNPSTVYLASLKADCLALLTLMKITPKKTTPSRLESRFTVVDGAKQIVVEQVSFSVANQLKHYVGDTCLIKFVGMEIRQ